MAHYCEKHELRTADLNYCPKCCAAALTPVQRAWVEAAVHARGFPAALDSAIKDSAIEVETSDEAPLTTVQIGWVEAAFRAGYLVREGSAANQAWEKMKAKLVPSSIEFKKGEVYFETFYSNGEELYRKYDPDTRIIQYDSRHLTPSEIPGWERDKEALATAVAALGMGSIGANVAEAVLAKIQEQRDR